MRRRRLCRAVRLLVAYDSYVTSGSQQNTISKPLLYSRLVGIEKGSCWIRTLGRSSSEQQLHPIHKRRMLDGRIIKSLHAGKSQRDVQRTTRS
ncbi:hypothetical protein TNCV_4636531 [Trichonephila clavipes]|nr:hypothetical protein TNCV_4636531 [Trichonephila clavipes]